MNSTRCSEASKAKEDLRHLAKDRPPYAIPSQAAERKCKTGGVGVGRQGGRVGVCRQLVSKTVQDVWEEDDTKKNRWRKTGSIWDQGKCKNKESDFFMFYCRNEQIYIAVYQKHPPAFVNRVKQEDANDSYLRLVDRNMDCRQWSCR